MDLMEQLNALGEEENVTDRAKGDFSPAPPEDYETEPRRLKRLKMQMANARDVASIDAIVASREGYYRKSLSEWDDEVRYRQDLIDDPLNSEDIDKLKLDMEYAIKKRNQFKADYDTVSELRKHNIVKGVARNIDDLHGTSVERGMWRTAGSFVTTPISVAQNVVGTLGYEDSAKSIGEFKEILTDTDDSVESADKKPIEWKEVKTASNLASYVGESVGSAIPWMLSGLVGGTKTIGTIGVAYGQGMMRESLEAEGVTDQATIRKASYVWGSLSGGLQAVVPWMVTKGWSKQAVKAFEGGLGQIAAKMAMGTAKVSAIQEVTMLASTLADHYGVSDATGKPFASEELAEKLWEATRQTIIQGPLFGAHGELGKLKAGAYRLKKDGATPKTPDEPMPPDEAPAVPTKEEKAEVDAAAREARADELATVKTPEAEAELSSLRNEQYKGEHDWLVAERRKIERNYITPLENELRELIDRSDITDEQRAALETEINAKLSSLTEQIEQSRTRENELSELMRVWEAPKTERDEYSIVPGIRTRIMSGARARADQEYSNSKEAAEDPNPYSEFYHKSRDIPDDINDKFQVHGLATGNPDESLISLIENGIDSDRGFNSGPPKPGTSDVDTTRITAPYLLVSDPGKTLPETGVKNVVLNGTAAVLKDRLSAKYQDVNFMTVDEAIEFMKTGEVPGKVPDKVTIDQTKADQILSSLASYLREEKVLTTKKAEGGGTILLMDGVEVARTEKSVGAREAVRVIADELRTTLEAEGRVLEADMRKMNLDEFTVAQKISEMFPELEAVSAEIGDLINVDGDGTLTVNVRELYNKVQAEKNKPAPVISTDERLAFREMLREKTPRKEWAQSMGVTPERLGELIDDAVQSGHLRIDSRGVARRTPKLLEADGAQIVALPDGEVVAKTELAQEKWTEMQAAADEVVAELADQKVRVVVQDTIETARSNSDQKYAIGKDQSGGSLSERVFGPQTSISEAGGTAREVGVGGRGAGAVSKTAGRSKRAKGAGPEGTRILRTEAATLSKDGTPIIGRRERGSGGRRTAGNIQRPETVRELSLLSDYDALITARTPHSADVASGMVAKVEYKFYEKGKPKGGHHQEDVEIVVKQHADGAWEVDWLFVHPNARGKKVATRAYDAIEKDLGIRLAPSGILTNDGLAFWKKRSPESVKWHQKFPKEDGTNYSPRKILDELERLRDMKAGVKNKKYLSKSDKNKLTASFDEEINGLREMWKSLPAEARDKEITDSMFSLRGFYSPAIRTVERLNQKRGTGEQFWKQITKTPGVRKEELAWMGVEEFLAGKESVTKEELLEFMRSHEIVLDELVLGDVEITSNGLKRINTIADTDPGIRGNIAGRVLSEIERGTIDPYKLREMLINTGDAAFRGPHLDYILSLYDKDAADNAALINKNRAKYSNYTITGGSGYKETLIRFPYLEARYTKEADARIDAIDAEIARLESSESSPEYIDAEVRTLFAEQNRLLDEGSTPKYKSKHFSDQEVVHVRHDEVADAELGRGKRIIEVQSDLLQITRRFGFGKEGLEKATAIYRSLSSSAFSRAVKDAVNHVAKKVGISASEVYSEWGYLRETDYITLAVERYGYEIQGRDYRNPITNEELKLLNKASEYIETFTDGAPNVPFSNDIVVEIALKKMLLNAVEGGYDFITWARSDQIAKAVGADPQDLSLQYDHKIKRFFDKYTKKWGGRVEQKKGLVGEDYSPMQFNSDELSDTARAIVESYGNNIDTAIRDIQELIADDGSYTTQAEKDSLPELIAIRDKIKAQGLPENQILRITPQMRASVLEGQPLSAKGDANVLGKADPDNLIIHLAMKAIEAEAASTGEPVVAVLRRTVRHELLEVAKAVNIISESEWAKLTSEAKEKGWVDSNGVRDAYEKMYKEDMDPQKLEDVIVKEAIMEQFANHESGIKKRTGVIGKIFDRVSGFVRSLVDKFKSRFGEYTSEDFFTALDSGELRKRFAKELGDVKRPDDADPLMSIRKAQAKQVKQNLQAKAQAQANTPLSKTEKAFADIRAELGLVMPTKAWKKGEPIGARQQAVAIAQAGGEELLRVHGAELAPALQPHMAVIEGMATPWSDKPFIEGFGQFFREYILRPDKLRLNHEKLYDDFRDAMDDHAPHMLDAMDRMHDLARERVKLHQSKPLVIQEKDKPQSTYQWAKDIKPKDFPGKVKNAFKRAFEAYARNFQPELLSLKAFEADAQYARYKSATAQERDSIEIAQDEPFKFWGDKGEKEILQYLRDVEIGAVQATPELQKLHRNDRKVLKNTWRLEKLWGSKAGYYEDYFPHIWTDPEKAAQFISELTAKDATWFQKKREIDTIQEGLNRGLKLKSMNPAEMVTMRLLAGVDMRMRMELLHDLKKLGLAHDTSRMKPPEIAKLTTAGWEVIKATNMDKWAIAPDAQALWKNAVSAKGLWGAEGKAGSIFRGWMAFKNVWVPIKLSVSLFHPLHVYHINTSEKFAQSWTQLTKNGDFTGAVKTFASFLDARQGQGFDGRMAWQKRPEERTGIENAMVKLFNDGGFVPQLSEQLRINAMRGLTSAMKEQRYFAALPHAIRRGTEKMQAAFFERWIPGVKAAAYLKEAQLLLERRPDLLNNDKDRRVALRAISKSIDNRFGEMFYGNLFWNRIAKDAGIASFLSMGWNLGFAREFLGAPMKAVTYPILKAIRGKDDPRMIAADANNKIAFTVSYLMSAAFANGAMTFMFTGEFPKDEDYIFARIGGTNPDGTPRRVTNMFYLREGPMLQKHIEENDSVFWGAADMLKNKLMFQPFIEMAQNRDYWGYEIADSSASPARKLAQYTEHVLTTQLLPITASGASRAAELSGTWADKSVPLSILGFGPAPAYVERTAMENHINHLYQKYEAADKKPYESRDDSEKLRQAKIKLRRALLNGDTEAAREARLLAKEAGATTGTLTRKRLNTPTSFFKFSRLPKEIQARLLSEASPEDYKKYRKYMSSKLRHEFPAQQPQD